MRTSSCMDTLDCPGTRQEGARGRFLDAPGSLRYDESPVCGAVAQLGARLNGIQEVTGSIPVSSTKLTRFLPEKIAARCL